MEVRLWPAAGGEREKQPAQQRQQQLETLLAHPPYCPGQQESHPGRRRSGIREMRKGKRRRVR